MHFFLLYVEIFFISLYKDYINLFNGCMVFCVIKAAKCLNPPPTYNLYISSKN